MPGSIAPLVMGWQRRMGAAYSPFSASGEASDGNPVMVEALINGVWTDITPYVMVRDTNGNITISRGRKDEGSTTEQSSCQLTLNNRDGRWSPRNPAGPYYGYIGRNTPIRVSVPNGYGGKCYRFQGEVSTWPQSWDPTGTDVWTEIQGDGILRRLSQGPPPANSVIKTALLNPVSPNLRAYWPMEDGSDATTIASALVTGSQMTWTGQPTLAGYDGFPASDPVPLTDGTIFVGGVPNYPDGPAIQVRFMCHIPADGLVNGTVVCSIDQQDYSAGSPQFWELYYGNYAGDSHGLTLHTLSSDGNDLGADLVNNYDVRGKTMYISIEMQESGTSITRALRIYDLTSKTSFDVTDVETLTQITHVTKVQFGPTSRSTSSPHGSTGLAEVAIGHVTVEDVITPITTLGIHLNPIGEAAGVRVQRVCAEAGIPFESIGDLTDTVLMGNQGKSNPLTLMQECEAADYGMLYESMPVLGIGYRTRVSLLNQDPQLTLDYAGFNLAEVPTPVEDDRYIQNQVTVTVGTVSQTYALTTGTLSTQLPPAGVGVYGQDTTLNLADSDDALTQAAWHVHMGTVDEPRYPAITVNLAHSSFVNNVALKQAVLALKQGDRIVIRNPPFWLPPGDIDQIILGFEETITHFEHRITFICAPASPYRVGVLDQSASRIDTDGSALVTDLGTSDTAILVATQTGPYWIQSDQSYIMPDDFPFDIRVGGEVMRVTAINASASDTFTRVTSNGWGTADTGQTWGTAGGTSSEFSTNGTVAQHSLTSINVSRYSILPSFVTPLSNVADIDARVDIATSALATGGAQYAHLVTRYQDINTLYAARVSFNTNQTLTLTLQKRVNGSQTDLTTVTIQGTHVANTFYTLRFKIQGGNLQAKCWQTGTTELDWQASAYDTDISVTGSAGVRSVLDSANTNVLPVKFSYDNFQITNPQTFTVTRSVNAVVKNQSAGTDVRLAYPTIISL